MKDNKHIQSFNEHQENLNISDVSNSKINTILLELHKEKIIEVNVRSRGFISSLKDKLNDSLIVFDCRLMDIEDINHIKDEKISKYEDKVVVFDNYKRCKYVNKIIELSKKITKHSEVILTINDKEDHSDIKKLSY